MKIAVIGANGQLGHDICQILYENKRECVELNHDSIEITDLDSVQENLTRISPTVVINTAAMNDVPRCEEEPQKAFLVNAIGPQNLAIASAKQNFLLIHISTDYVFDGRKKSPYLESDTPNPLNVYGKSKLEGERLIQSHASKYLILRTCGLYGRYPCRGKSTPNFVERMLKLAAEKKEIKVVDDEILTPTSTLELARQIDKILDCKQSGIYHATAEGECSWFHFAEKIFDLNNSGVKLTKAKPGDFPYTVNRPKYSVLENQRLKKLKLNTFKSWEDGLSEYLQNHTEQGN